MRKIMENVFLFQDTCNVYLVKNGSEAIAIDFGSGNVLNHLSEIEVERITDVLMTHHHRDQGQGLALAADRGIRIWVPHVEQELFHSVNEHWQSREIFNNYNVRQDKFSLLESVQIAGTLKDYAAYSFGNRNMTVLPTPGHTVGSISVLLEINGAKIVFSGDLIAGAGKVWSMAALQWTYSGAEGVQYSILSLLDLQERDVDLLLPSHGDVIDHPDAAINQLVRKLRELLQLRKQDRGILEMRNQPYEQLTPHFLMNKTSLSKSYVVLSDSGKALLIDFGYDFSTGMIPAGYDRSSRRPWLYTIEWLKRNYGISHIDVALPTHIHDDHVAGLNVLRQVEQTQIWAAENFADILENPLKYDLPCIWYDPIRVDKTIPLGKPFWWEEYEFTLYEQAGHTLNAVAISFEVDGKKVVAIGDQQDHNGDLSNYVYKNRFRFADYKLSAELYINLQPDLMVSGHWPPVWVDSDYLTQLLKDGKKLEQIHHDLLPAETLNMEAEGFCAWIRPYQITMTGGEKVSIEVEILSPCKSEEEICAALIFPPAWGMEPQARKRLFSPYERGYMNFEFILPSVTTRRARIAVDITVGAKRIGQQAEALITIVAPNRE